MAFEIPYDQIRELQISLRKEAAVDSYKPEDPQLPDLPLLQDAISDLDLSPPYVRCKHCQGRLLRGTNSVICVFCGRQQNNGVPPDPIKFTSTIGCRWFLQYLDLDGSELVARSIEANESNKGPNTPEIAFSLSDLLDLEIRWPSEPEEFESSVSENTPAQQLSTLSLAGVDLDNFFTEAKPSEEVPARPKEDGSGESFSGWEADFQSAGSGTQQQESKLSDPFVGSAGIGTQQQESQLSDPFVQSSLVDLSSHMDDVFAHAGKDLIDNKTNEYTTSASNMNDWLEGDL
ncbi:hypothetical protein GH714_017957 [Hevea brasiliensis]|uniref:DUF7815 domain-containing protein n=1 Tax=Hevea brasiliensis TaxID=3981 RepID=A0A6A6KTA2_HEVBR|nr:hypothetical protein GH714_017957 [Hevea brasiliensis]